MTTTSAKNAIAVLIDLAQQGEIDPWDVKVIDVIDRFLSELGLTEAGDTPCQPDLPQSGQAFLWASMLVLLKADTLKRLEDDDEEEPEEDAQLLPEGDSQGKLPQFLERHLRRRASAPAAKKRRVTLQELIGQIREIAAELEAEPSSKRSRKTASSRREAARAIALLAHNENLTEVAAQLEKFLALDFPCLAPGQSWIELDQLLQYLTAAKFPSTNDLAKPDRVGVFWGLLLLSAQSKVELCQEEFYHDLTIRPLCQHPALKQRGFVP